MRQKLCPFPGHFGCASSRASCCLICFFLRAEATKDKKSSASMLCPRVRLPDICPTSLRLWLPIAGTAGIAQAGAASKTSQPNVASCRLPIVCLYNANGIGKGSLVASKHLNAAGAGNKGCAELKVNVANNHQEPNDLGNARANSKGNVTRPWPWPTVLDVGSYASRFSLISFHVTVILSTPQQNAKPTFDVAGTTSQLAFPDTTPNGRQQLYSPEKDC